MLGSNMKQIRKSNKVTQKDLAAALGVTQQAIASWESGRSTPDPTNLKRMADFLCVSVDMLLEQQDSFGISFAAQKDTPMVPIIGTVRAGYGAMAFEEDLGLEPANVRDPENYFYLVVKGNSMEPRIQDGDLALVRKQQTLDDGDLGVVVFGEGEGTLKRFQRIGNSIVLQPFNPDYDRVIVKGADLNNLYIAGKVVETKARW